MTEAFLGIGSNIEPEINIPLALKRLGEFIEITEISPFYRTKAIGTALGQNDFINGVVKVRTDKTARFLKYEILRKIEFSLGRTSVMPKYSPRTIDLDILIFGNQIIPELNIPEPEINQRPFVYIPLHDINPEYQLPANNKEVSENCILQKVTLIV